MSEKSKAQDEVRANRFALVDAKGRVRAALEMDGDDPILRMYGPADEVQILLGFGPGGTTRLILKGPDLATKASLAAAFAGEATLELGAERRKVLASSNDPGQYPSVVLTDDNGRVVAKLPPQ